MKNAMTMARIIPIVMMVITVVTVEPPAGTYLLLIAILCNHQPKFGTHSHGFR